MYVRLQTRRCVSARGGLKKKKKKKSAANMMEICNGRAGTVDHVEEEEQRGRETHAE